MVWDLDGSSNLEELNMRLRQTCFVRRTKAQVLKELPPIQRTRVVLPLTNRAEYAKAERDLIGWIRENKGKIAATAALRAQALVRINELKQLAVTGKIAAIREWAQQFVDAEDKLVLFAHYHIAQDALREAFPGSVAIRGGQSAIETENAKKAFNEGTADLIVCSLLAGGVGHTLHANGKCSSLAFAEFGWSPSDMQQGEARIHRIGQTAEAVNVYYLVAEGTIDEEIEALLAEKQAVVDAATDGAAKEVALNTDIFEELVKRLAAGCGKATEPTSDLEAFADVPLGDDEPGEDEEE
jgi:SWI/SNF-related matrix-associated actin-dependent regulator of chromatin subfamily A-like protein 1